MRSTLQYHSKNAFQDGFLGNSETHRRRLRAYKPPASKLS